MGAWDHLGIRSPAKTCDRRWGYAFHRESLFLDTVGLLCEETDASDSKTVEA